MVAVAAIGDEDVQIREGIDGEGVPEIGYQFRVEIADFLRGKVGLKDEIRPAAEIQCARAKRFFHGERKMAIAADARLFAHRLAKSLSQADPDVFHGVMLIDLQVSDGCDREVEGRVFG